MKLNPKYSRAEQNVVQHSLNLWAATAKAVDAAQAKFPGLGVATIDDEVVLTCPKGVTAAEVMAFIKSQL